MFLDYQQMFCLEEQQIPTENSIFAVKKDSIFKYLKSVLKNVIFLKFHWQC